MARRAERGGLGHNGALLRHAGRLLLESETATAEALEVSLDMASRPLRHDARDLRRREVADLRSRGQSIRAIAQQVGIGVGTVHRLLHG